MPLNFSEWLSMMHTSEIDFISAKVSFKDRRKLARDCSRLPVFTSSFCYDESPGKCCYFLNDSFLPFRYLFFERLF